MPRTRCVDSQRLRASQALPLAILIVLAVFLGTPSRHDHQEAMAQPPTQIPLPRPLRPPAGPGPATVPFPMPNELASRDLSRQTPG